MSIVYTFKYKSDIMYNLVFCELLSSIFVCHCVEILLNATA